MLVLALAAVAASQGTCPEEAAAGSCLLQLRGARAKLAKPGRAAVGVAASLDEEFSTWVRVSGEPLSRSTPLVV